MTFSCSSFSFLGKWLTRLCSALLVTGLTLSSTQTLAAESSDKTDVAIIDPEQPHSPTELQRILNLVLDEIFGSGHSIGNHIITHYAYNTHPLIKNFLIDLYIRKYNVDLSELMQPDPGQYNSLADFFVRQLKPDARTIDTRPNVLISPVDGTVSQSGKIIDGTLLQVKGHTVPLQELFGGDEELTQRFQNGTFATLYLSPSNYHRVHMPYPGSIQESILIPGHLGSVNLTNVQIAKDLYGTNERMVQIFHHEETNTPFAIVWIGAMNIGSIETAWASMNPQTAGPIRMTHNREQIETQALKGQQIGYFNFGSTVILIFPTDHAPKLVTKPGQQFRLGQPIGYFPE